MACGSCGDWPSKFQPEYTRQWKPENNAGCSCGGSGRNDCAKPSLAKPGSALAAFEAIYGKVVTKITFQQGQFGRTMQVVEKTLCPIVVDRPSRHGCCSLRYIVKR